LVECLHKDKMPKKVNPLTHAEEQALMRTERILNYANARSGISLPKLSTKTDFARPRPTKESIDSIYNRTNSFGEPVVASVWERLITGKDAKDAAKVLNPKAAKGKLRKHEDYVGTYNMMNGILRPEYDMLEPFVMYDTEAYLKQAITRRLALMFRNGYEIVTDLDQDVEQGQKNIDYIYKRLNAMEYVSIGESTNAFFRKILYNLLLGSNCFLLKIRDEELSAGVKNKGEGNLPNNNNKVPIARYQLVPSHTILPYFEGGIIKHWRRFFDTGAPWVDYKLEEVVHIRWDVKPGHVYGTPRTVGVRDDIYALRRFEENIELLFVNHLFPFFHVKIGTEKAPCTYGPNGESEIDTIRYQIETMPKEGIFTTDERVSVDVVGAEGKSLEVKEFLSHLKSRVFTGLGVSGIDMGEGDTTSRATADNISQNLKDAVKTDAETFADLLRLHFFKEWFLEANYSVSVQKAVSTTRLVFHEIDLDNKIKHENHVLNLYNAHLYTEPEARKLLKKPPMTKADKNLTHYKEHILDLAVKTIQAKADAEIKAQEKLLPMQAEHQEKLTGHRVNEMQAEHGLEHKKMTAHVAKAEASTKLTAAKAKLAAIQGTSPKGVVKKATPSLKVGRTRATPSNQHKVNLGPTKAKSSRDEFQNLLADELQTEWSKMQNEGIGSELWATRSSQVVDRVLASFETSHQGNPEDPTEGYTNQVRQGLPQLKDMIAQTTDPEMLAVLVDAWDGEDYDGSEME
jgi:hypothetical protein